MIFISTTGTKDIVMIPDLGHLEIPHPSTNLELEKNFRIESLAESKDLQAAIAEGSLSVIDTVYSYYLFRLSIFQNPGWQRLKVTMPSYVLSEIVGAIGNMDNSIVALKVIWNNMLDGLDEADKPSSTEIASWKAIAVFSKTKFFPPPEKVLDFDDEGKLI